MFARVPSRGDVPVAHAPQQAGLGERDLAPLSLDLTATGIDYAVGDAFGVLPPTIPRSPTP